MLPPPPKQDTVIATDSMTNPTLVKVRDASAISPDLLPTIPGYEVLSRLGQGGMGRVFKARHLGLRRMDAIKMVTVGASPHLITRFMDEARAIARLKHPNIAQVYDSGEVDGQPFYAMELVEAGTLAQKLLRQPQEARWSARLIMTLAQAVHYFHQHGIIHRDLKPSNVLMEAEGEPKIADFGLVKNIGSDSQNTETGDIIGTPSYMSPEQASGMVKSIGPASDIYALGAILYECLTGRPPFQTPDGMQTLMLVITEEPVPPSKLVPKLPKDLNTICMKCLEKQPGRRYATAQALADDLVRFMEGESIIARPVGRVEKTWKWCRRRPAWAALILVGLLSLVGFTAGFFWLSKAYADMSEAKKESDILLRGSNNVVSGMARHLEGLSAIPHTEGIRQQGLMEVKKLYEQLVSIRPRDLASREQYVEACIKLAQVERSLNQFDQADAAYQRAFDMLDQIIRESTADQHYAQYLQVMVQRANMERERRELDRAQEFMAQAEPLAEKLEKQPRPSLVVVKSLSDYHSAVGQSCRVKQQFAESDRHYRLALQYLQRALSLEGKEGERDETLAMAHNNLGTILIVEKQYDEAAKEFEKALTMMPLERHPRIENFLGMLHANRAIVAEQLKQWKDSQAAYERAAGCFKQLMIDFPMTPDYRFRWARIKLNLIRSLMERDYVATKPLIEEVQPVLEQLVKDYPQQPAYREQLKMLGICKETLASLQSGIK